MLSFARFRGVDDRGKHSNDRPRHPLPSETSSTPVIAAGPAPSLRAGFGLFVAALAVVVAIAVIAGADGNYFASPPPIGRPAAEFTLTRGGGERRGDAWVVQATDASGTAVLSVNVGPFAAAPYSRIDIDLKALGPSRPRVALLWRTREHPGRMNAKPLEWTGDRVRPLHVGAEDGWDGTVTGLALVVRAPLKEPLALGGATVGAGSALGKLAEIAGQWAAFFPLRAHSNHFPFDEERDYPLSPLATVALAQVLGIGAYLVWARRRQQAPARRMIAFIFLAGWMLLDLRWQANLWRQLGDTAAAFAGKSTEEKHASGVDRELYALAQRVLAKLPQPPARIAVLARNDSLRFRVAYFLYPHSVNGIFGPEPRPGDLRTGDHVLLFFYDSAAYDRDTQALVWTDGQRRSVDELLIESRDVALVRVR